MTPMFAILLTLAIPVVVALLAVGGLYLSKGWQGYQDARVWRNSRLETALQARRDRREEPDRLLGDQ